MRQLLLLIAVMPLGACAQTGEDWPSLARRPAETRAATPPVAAGSASDPAVGARLGVLERDVGAARARWDERAVALATARTAVGGGATGSETWADAQLALTRLETAGARWDALRLEGDAVAGDLARGWAAGRRDPAALARAGAALERIEDGRRRHRDAVMEAQRTLAR